MKRLLSCISGAALLAASATTAQAQTIELWSFLDPADDGVRNALLAEIIADFEAEHEGVSVETNVIQWTELGNQLLRADRAGSVPDIVMLYSPYMQPQVAAGTLAPLDPYMEDWSEDERDDVITVPMARGTDGTLYGLPWELRAYGMIYRTDLYEQAGLERPETIEEMTATLSQLMEEGREGISTSFSPATSTAPMEWILPATISLGGEVIAEDGSAAFQGPEMEQVLQMFYDLTHESGVIPLETALLSADDAQNLAISGQAAAHAQGSHRLTTIQERSEEGATWAFTPFPSIDEAHPMPLNLEGWNAVIPAKAENPDLAWEFIEKWVSFDVQLKQAVEAGYLPVRRSVAQSEEFQTEQNVAFRLPEILEYAAEHPLDFDWPENSDAMNNVLGRMAQQVLTDSMTPAEATAWGEDEYNSLRR